ncbi:MAG: hypothetical protein J6S67_01445 [Methanobrevibacter sp.]|nr:hypothetical protein [Methanobrevibacter sp.]
MYDAITRTSKDDNKIIFRDGFITILRRPEINKYNWDDLRVELKHEKDSDIFTVLDLPNCKQVVADIEYDNASLDLEDIAMIWPDAYMVIYETPLDGSIYKRERSFEGYFYWKRIGTTVGYGG